MPAATGLFGKLAWIASTMGILATIVCGYMGRLERADAFHVLGWRAGENAAFLTLRAFVFDGIYVDDAKLGGNLLLLVARWTGLVVSASGLIGAALSLSGSRVAAFRLGLHRGHTLIWGDQPVVQPLLKQAIRRRLKVVHATGSATRTPSGEGLIVAPTDDPARVLSLAGADQAQLIIVAENDPGISAQNALAAAH